MNWQHNPPEEPKTDTDQDTGGISWKGIIALATFVIAMALVTNQSWVASRSSEALSILVP